ASQSLIPVAMFGRTFKGQKYDAWARQGTKKLGRVRLALRVGGREVLIERCRRPSRLQLWVDGVDQSSGMNSGTEGGTQQLIEQVIGLTWQTLANAVYIDPAVSRSFLFGTQKERTGLLAKMQNLERFEMALMRVRLEDKKWVGMEIELREARAAARERVDLLRHQRDKELKNWREALREANERWETARSDCADKRKRADKSMTAADRAARVTVEDAVGLQKAKDDLANASFTVKRQRMWLEARASGKECTECRRPLTGDEWESIRRTAEKTLLDAETVERERQDEVEKLKIAHEPLVKKQRELDDIARREHAMFSASRGKLKELARTLEVAKKKSRRVHQDVASEIEQAKRLAREWRAGIAMVAAERRFLAFCSSVFSRDGMPAMLNAEACPGLDAAAAAITDEMTNGQLQVRFEASDGELQPTVINPNGGAALDDLSDGERALAGIVASLALRTLAPKCNLLIVDEPGTGLDAVNTRAVAKALKQVAERENCTVFAITHDQVMAQELAGAKRLHVVKENGVSSTSWQRS
ncbi:MAG: AAA family ATPase, partial [Patescibacteria group bacterium]|nr:AAA family ATPase [Patescibacteria group bacterium]